MWSSSRKPWSVDLVTRECSRFALIRIPTRETRTLKTRRLLADKLGKGLYEPWPPSLADKPPTGAAWLHEIKHDSFRMLVRGDVAGVNPQQARLDRPLDSTRPTSPRPQVQSGLSGTVRPERAARPPFLCHVRERWLLADIDVLRLAEQAAAQPAPARPRRRGLRQGLPQATGGAPQKGTSNYPLRLRDGAGVFTECAMCNCPRAGPSASV